MKNLTNNHFTYNQGFLPLFISDCLDILDPVFTFDRFMEGIDLTKYLKNVPKHITGRVRYNPVSMLKTVLFGFMTSGYCSLRELEDNCKVNLRFMYLMDRETPSHPRPGVLPPDPAGQRRAEDHEQPELFRRHRLQLQ